MDQDELDLTNRMQEIARIEVTQVLAGATIPKYPAYFMEGHWLVTVEWLKAFTMPLESEIAELRREIAELKRRRWWQR